MEEHQLNWSDFNEMTYERLRKIPGIGMKVADRIIACRPFRCNNDLFKVRGLGKSTLKKLGIEKTQKERINWVMMYDGIEYPKTCLAKNTLTNQIDFFWRIEKSRREYLK